MTVFATVQRCYSDAGHGGKSSSSSWRLGEAVQQTPSASLCTKPYLSAFGKNLQRRVADPGRVRLGAYAPALGPPRR